jgi:restriction system protein
VEVDVHAEETVKGRRYTILVECKNWETRVPQGVIHSFRTVVADSGANLGYIVSSAGFQSGAFTASELTNVRLVDWQGFQNEFEQTWLEHHLVPYVTQRLDPLFTYTEPLLPRAFDALTEEEQAHFLSPKDKYDAFGWLMTTFTTYSRILAKAPLPTLPLRDRLKPGAQAGGVIPLEVLDATGYRELVSAAVSHGDVAISEFRRALKRDAV